MMMAHSRYTAGVLVAATISLLVVVPACAKKKAKQWTPRPLVHWDDIVAGPVAAPVNGYRILVEQPTQGLFPADIAVTRVSVEIADEDAMRVRYPRLAPEPRNEYLQWNAAFDDLMAISEVFPIAQMDMGGARVDPLQILAAFRALRARMGLIYAVNELSEDEAEMIGALYSIGKDEPIASFHARAVAILPAEDRHVDDPDNLWETEAHALVRKEFERIVYRCVRAMILDDKPAALEDTSAWSPPGPLRPPEWPPRNFPPDS